MRVPMAGGENRLGRKADMICRRYRGVVYGPSEGYLLGTGARQ